MTSLKTSIKTITYLSDIGCLEIQGASLGAAWVYEQYNTDPVLPVLQNEARQQKRGLWSDADPVPPWIWRHRK